MKRVTMLEFDHAEADLLDKAFAYVDMIGVSTETHGGSWHGKHERWEIERADDVMKQLAARAFELSVAPQAKAVKVLPGPDGQVAGGVVSLMKVAKVATEAAALTTTALELMS